MKSFITTIKISALACSLLYLVGCGSDDDGVSPEELQLSLLTKTWIIQSATQNIDRTSVFMDPDMTLTISGAFNHASPKGPYAYNIAGSLPSPSPWAEGDGSWSFGANVSTQIIRDDGVEMNYAVTGKTLTLTFTCITCDEDHSRLNSAEGGWVFVFESAP